MAFEPVVAGEPDDMSTATRNPSQADTEQFLCGAVVADGVRRYDDGIVNWYLIEDGDRLTVVDAGFPPDWSMLTTSLGTIGRRLSDVHAVVVTHAHVDHIGFAERARKECGATVYVHEDDAKLAADPKAIAKSEKSPLRYLGHGATRQLMLKATKAGAPLAKGVREVRRFVDGEILEDVPGRPVAVHTPGHTDGHCAFHLPDRRVVFAGDAIVTRDPYTGATGPQVVSAAATKDMDRAFASLDRFAALDANVLLPGHGDPWRGSPAEAARLAREAGPS
jgi:glyoxylase-like metal-dependent hydrolase (beta-lactamase superfamily II)